MNKKGWMAACLLAATAAGASAGAVKTGLVGVALLDTSFADVAGTHDPAAGPVYAVDVFANAGASFKMGTVIAKPDKDYTRLSEGGLPLLTFSNGNDPLTAYGIQDFKASTKATVNGVHGIRSKLLLIQGGIDSSKSISAGSGTLAQYQVVGPQSIIEVQFTLAITGDIAIPDTRTGSVFSIGATFSITDIAGAPLVTQTGVWQGGHGSEFRAGLLNAAGITTSSSDADDVRTRSIAGDTSWIVSLPTDSYFNLQYTTYYTLSGPAGEASDPVVIDLGDTVELTFGPGPGFEGAQLILIPEPATAWLLLWAAGTFLHRRSAGRSGGR